MKCHVLLAVAAFVLIIASSKADSSSFIIGGSDAAIEDYPYMAGVMNFGFISCGGSIISARNVLTAAHCILFNNPAAISVFVGSSWRGGQGGRSHGSLRIFIHPDYVLSGNPFKIQNDVAIIRTLSPIRFGRSVQPIQLGTGFIPPGARVVLTGWGLVQESPDILANRLQMLDMNTLSNIACSRMHVGTDGEGLITDEKICAVGRTPGSTGCRGDSGSPLVWRGAVVGIVSWGMLPCGSVSTVLVRVAHHAQWIQHNT